METIEDKIIGICMREFKYDCGEAEQAAARNQIKDVLDHWVGDLVRITDLTADCTMGELSELLARGSSW